MQETSMVEMMGIPSAPSQWAVQRCVAEAANTCVWRAEGVGDLILDIFGDSENDDEEFAGFGEEDVSKANKAQGAIISDSDVEEEEDDEPGIAIARLSGFFFDYATVEKPK